MSYTGALLADALGYTYGGPSISYENGKFVLYEWYDAPVKMEVLVSDSRWDRFLEKIDEYLEENESSLNDEETLVDEL